MICQCLEKNVQTDLNGISDSFLKLTPKYLPNIGSYYAPQNLALSESGSQLTKLHPCFPTSLSAVPFPLALLPLAISYSMPYSKAFSPPSSFLR